MWRLLSMRCGKNKCTQTRGRLSAYLDQRLGLQEQGEIERHLETCQRCQQELESLQTTVQLLHQVPQVLPARSFAVSEARPLPRRSLFPVLRTATAVMAVFLVLIFAFDMTNLFHTGPISTPENGTQSYGPSEKGNETDFSWAVTGDVTSQEKGEAGWVHPLEYGILGGVVVLGGVTIVVWRDRKRTAIRESDEDVA
jgi:hypothetical protein